MENQSKKEPVIELYRAIQSEGSKAGTPHIVLRTTGCTHRCWFGEGGFCDSWYTSIHPEKGKFTFEEIENFLSTNMDINHLMITGGSPTMHPKLINNIVNLFHSLHGLTSFITLETEGSHFLQTDRLIDLISISPKFSNSVPKLGITTPLGDVVDEKFINQHNKFRLNKEVIKSLINYHVNYHFKPVVNPEEQPEIWAEIEEFIQEMGIPKSKVWIMPPGDNREEIIRTMPMVIDFCAKNGYCYSGRDHIVAFDQQRAV